MRVQNSNDDKNIVVFTKWVSGNGKMPVQATKATEKFEIELNSIKIDVYGNKSKTGVQYYYAQIAGEWSWSRDKVIAKAKYAKVEKAAKVEKTKTVEAPKVETVAAGLTTVTAPKIIRKNDK